MRRLNQRMLIVCACLFTFKGAHGQSAAPPLDYEPSEHSSFTIFQFVKNLFLPSLVKDEMKLKRYVRDGRFRGIRAYYGDLTAVDALYSKALQLVDYNVRDALLITFFATMDHRRVGVKLPVLNSLSLPLTAESDSLFHLRWSNLPSRLYTDGGNEGDRDKLQHFFGSAFIAYGFRSSESASLAASFVEWGEETFIVGGLNDWRDGRADDQGSLFGQALEEDPSLLPSMFFRTPSMNEIVESQRAYEIGPCGGR